MEEVLWNFSRLKGVERITLKQNPNFYCNLPSSTDAYGGDYSTDPIENFRNGTEFFILTDEKSRRVFLEANEKKRVFGNFWVLEPDATRFPICLPAIIFKGQRVVRHVPVLSPV